MREGEEFEDKDLINQTGFSIYVGKTSFVAAFAINYFTKIRSILVSQDKKSKFITKNREISKAPQQISREIFQLSFKQTNRCREVSS